MPIPHDPTPRARLTFRWRDERWHLLDRPRPGVILISDNVPQGFEYGSSEAAEGAFWTQVVDSVFAWRDRHASARWPGVEIAAVFDEVNRQAIVAERTRRHGCQVLVLDDKVAALAAFHKRVHSLAGEAVQ
ncbi:hypothetical protein [Nonomuraea insulae]|uniref:Uncharacterized protein n=1 Tax=Nonomuraea insulae TaxID=1616787 RepID=A0ABW1CR84_9ACTN